MRSRDVPTTPEAPVARDELERLARKYDTSIAQVDEVIKQIHAIARVEIEAALQARSSAHDHEIERLAHKHRTTVERVRRIMRATGSQSPAQVEAALAKHLGQTTSETGTGGSG